MFIKETTIYYINRECDTKRKSIFEKKLNDLGINNYKRIQAIDGLQLLDEDYQKKIAKVLNQDIEKLKPKYWNSKKNFKSIPLPIERILPKVGCLLSHLKVLKIAMENKLNNILIMEDDAKLINNWFDEFIIPNDSDIIYLGGTFKKIGKTKKINNGLIKISSDYLKLFGTFGYYIPTFEKIKEIYSFLNSIFLEGIGRKKLKDFRSGKNRILASSIDRLFVNHYQKNGNTYFINPPIITHNDNGISTIGNNLRKYKLKFKYQ